MGVKKHVGKSARTRLLWKAFSEVNLSSKASSIQKQVACVNVYIDFVGVVEPNKNHIPDR